MPYAEASAFMGLPSAFYKESHYRFRADLRRFFDVEAGPFTRSVSGVSVIVVLRQTAQQHSWFCA